MIHGVITNQFSEILKVYGVVCEINSRWHKIGDVYIPGKQEIPLICDRCFSPFSLAWENLKTIFFKKHYCCKPVRKKGRVKRQVSQETRDKLSAAMCEQYRLNKRNRPSRRYKTGYYNSLKNGVKMWHRSGYELKAFEILEADNTVLTYQSEVVFIPYIWRNRPHNYIVDILVQHVNGDKTLIEVKTKARRDKCRKTIAKLDALKIYCEINNYKCEIWTEEELAIKKN